MPSYTGGVGTQNNNYESGNYVVENNGTNVLVNTNFMMRVEGVYDVPCKKVLAIERQNEFEYIQEGGLNDYIHMRRKYITKPFTLTIERYTGYDWIDPLPLGSEPMLPILLFVSRYPGLFVPGMLTRTYVFTGCTVIGKTWGELNAEQSGLLVETTQIVYREFSVTTLSFDPNVEDTGAIPQETRQRTEVDSYQDLRAIPRDTRMKNINL